MAAETLISWADHTHNHWIGCARVSPACDGCYAAHLMETRLGRVEWGGPGKGQGTRSLTSESNRRKPMTWEKKAAKAGNRPFVFCSSLADVFDNQVPAEWRADLFDLIRKTPNLVWLLLTKRPQNIIKLSGAAGGLPANAAIGTTVEDQERADLNVPALSKAKAATRPAFSFLSCEPLLGPVVIPEIAHIDWVITGGETDQGEHKARPYHPNWFSGIRDQCSAAGVPYHHKQNGEWKSTRVLDHWVDDTTLVWPDGQIGSGGANEHGGPAQHMIKVGKHRTGRDIDGVEHDAFPAIRRVA